jgi:DNA modification methylase
VISLPLVGVNKGHPAVFPPDLPAFFIKLLSPAKGLIVDPFGGSGMSALAAIGLGRDCILIDNEKYAKLAYENLQNEYKDKIFEAELCFPENSCVVYPTAKTSPLTILKIRHGILKKTDENKSKNFQKVV